MLPHPGGGGETYVDALSRMDGYRFERVYLSPGPRARDAAPVILFRAAAAQRAAFSFDLIHVVGEVASTMCLPVLALRPSVVSPQGLSLVRRLDGVARRLAEANLRLIARAATWTVCSGAAERADVVGVTGSRASGRVAVIRNGVAPGTAADQAQKEGLRSDLGLAATGVVGAWVGALDENKDPLTPVHAANALRRQGMPISLVLAGDGPLRAEVERVARETDAVRVLGFRRDIERILCASDFVVLASRWEGLSFALLEGMSRALVPVVSDAPGNVEAVGDAGVVVPFGDRDAFAAAFVRIANDEDQRLALGRRARERAISEFHVDDMIRRTRELYDQLAQVG